MAVSSSSALVLPSIASRTGISPSLPTLRFPRRTRQISLCSSSSPTPMEEEPLQAEESRSKFTDFPHVSPAHRDLMAELVSSVETRLRPDLHPCTLPPDVQFYQNPNGSALAALHVRKGLPSSPIDFIIGSWIHGSKLPPGGVDLNITTLYTYLRPSTDAPNFLIEFIQTSPLSLVLILDLPPRKDLVMHPDYLKVFYEDTQLDRHRERLMLLPEVRPYYSRSLYVRASFSPSSILVSIEANSVDHMEDIVRDHVSPVAKEMLEIWLELCACAERGEVGVDESRELARRDRVFRNKGFEIDLESSYPRLFGQEVANRVLRVLRDVILNA
ncbi:hypothetical protein DM860_002980 [Cuscuta australis]|uniref:Red chlorophyll catabolite reductase n=1 Tax=Cuscuta australis TaxID=267555 RepID=A0A328D125_9ASTE|nr:hypothetical protein DM860_002980 [Cuscuta australis]